MRSDLLAELRPAAKAADLRRPGHWLMLCPSARVLPDDLPQRELLLATLRRRGEKVTMLSKTAVSATAADGSLCVWVMFDAAKSVFERHTLLRSAVSLLLEEHPGVLSITLCGDPSQRRAMAECAVYVAWVNGTPMPAQRRKADAPLKRIVLQGWDGDLSDVRACAAGNVLARRLTALPPNELTPGMYRRKIVQWARQEGWEHEEYDFARLQKMQAGAFVAVAQGSTVQDAAIVRLSYVPKRSRGTVALVGKGICFDTGGHNLKPAKYMAGMHEDMNGSAVALGLLLAATWQGLPLRIDVWLAIASNQLSPLAYRQGDIVQALDGTSIEVVHTDAEGRMVLADALTLASRGVKAEPELLFSFATLTCDMITALGTRYCGVFSSSEQLAALAVAAGAASGERVCVFPFDEDYAADLDSDVADIKQCSLEAEADHILAACFLRRFVGKRPWLHVDLSAANNDEGLGAVASDLTGFGVAWGLELLRRRLAG